MVGWTMRCPCCAQAVVVRRVPGGTLTCAPNGSSTNVLSATCPYPRCASLVFALAAKPDEPLGELVSAPALRLWFMQSIAMDALRTAPLVGFVMLFAFGPLGAVRMALAWSASTSDRALVVLGAIVAVLPAIILFLTIAVGLVSDTLRTRDRFGEVFSGAGGGLCLTPEPSTYRG